MIYLLKTALENEPFTTKNFMRIPKSNFSKLYLLISSVAQRVLLVFDREVETIGTGPNALISSYLDTKAKCLYLVPSAYA